MDPAPINGATHRFAAPDNWNADTHGPCATIEVREDLSGGFRMMVSAWQPTKAEIAAIILGAPIHLWISGNTHPVVCLTVPPVEASLAQAAGGGA